MIELIITIVIFLLLILMVVWLPFVKQQLELNRTIESGTNHLVKEAVTNQRDETNVRLYHEHKAEIEKDYAEGSIDQENYQYLLAELDKSLLQDIEGNEAAHITELNEKKTHSILWPLTLSLFVIVFSFAFYLKTGAYKQLNQPVVTAEHQQSMTAGQKALENVKQLHDFVAQEPENSEAWYSLGQQLVGLGQFQEAMDAYDQVIRIEGQHADLLGAKAQASYYNNNQQIDVATQGFIDDALKLDPVDPSTNILLGMHNFTQKNYLKAISHWQKVVDAQRQNVNSDALQEGIKEAKKRLAEGEPTEQQKNGLQRNEQDSGQLSGPQLNLEVSLSKKFAEQLQTVEDKVVFIYAISADGETASRMPVAAAKVSASDLPLTIVLNDTLAMTPQAKLSMFNKVHLYAVVSNSGGVGIKSGDFKAEKMNVTVASTDVITLVIDKLEP
jgi:cytochrome c-type biogenesis protein CcmH